MCKAWRFIHVFIHIVLDMNRNRLCSSQPYWFIATIFGPAIPSVPQALPDAPPF